MRGAGCSIPALLFVLLAAPGSVHAAGFGGEWVADGIALNLTEEADRVNGVMSVGAPPDNELTLSARISSRTGQFKGTLWRNGQSVDVWGSLRNETLGLRIRFTDGSTRYYTLRPKLGRFRSVFLARSDVNPMTLVLERRRVNGPTTGWVTHERRRTRLSAVRFESGVGMKGRVEGGGEFVLYRPTNHESLPKGAQILRWPAGRVVLVQLSEVESSFKGATKVYRHPQGYFRCSLPQGWTVKPTPVARQIAWLMPSTHPTREGDGLALLAWSELSADEVGKTARALLKAEQATLPSEALAAFKLRLPTNPRYQDVLIDGRPAALARWAGTIGAKRCRLWTVMVVARGIKVEALMFCEERLRSGCEPQFAQMLKTLKVLKLRAPRKR